MQFPPEFEFKAALANGFSNAQRAVTLDNSECLATPPWLEPALHAGV